MRLILVAMVECTDKILLPQVARRPLESEHGDPFTLLNAFDEWVQVQMLRVNLTITLFSLFLCPSHL